MFADRPMAIIVVVVVVIVVTSVIVAVVITATSPVVATSIVALITVFDGLDLCTGEDATIRTPEELPVGNPCSVCA